MGTGIVNGAVAFLGGNVHLCHLYYEHEPGGLLASNVINNLLCQACRRTSTLVPDVV